MRGILFLVLAFLIANSWSALLGSSEEVDVKNKDALDAADMAFKEVDIRRNSMLQSRLLFLTSAKKQIVSGTIWWLTFQLGETDCVKNFELPSKEPGSDCHVQKVEECKVKLYTVPWKSVTDLQEFDCKPQGSLVGGSMEQTELSDDAKKAAEASVEYVNQHERYAYRVGLSDITSVNTQVVAGVKYTIALKLGATKCKNIDKNKNADSKQCPVYGKKTQDCKLVVVHTAWVKDSPFTVVSCDCCKKSSTEKRSAVDPVLIQGQPVSSQLDSHSPLLLRGEPMKKQNVKSEVEKATAVRYAAYWVGFKNHFKKNYTQDEEDFRFKVFTNNMVKAETMQRAERGTAKYGITPFSDLTEEEFGRRLSKRWDLNIRPEQDAAIPNLEVPDSFDWRDHGAVTPVKNQGSCGSCWAFSTTGNVEGQWKIKKGKLVSLSEQELVDCDKVDQGCGGGLPSIAYKQIMKLGGLETEMDYAYEGEDEKCTFNRNKVSAYVNGSVAISKDEAEMAAWLVKNGPISIGLNANAMMWYMGGISYPWRILCNPASLDHGVLIVGFGSENGKPYWIIKNSWGTSWGEDGYYRLYRGAGVCGVNQMATSAIVD